MSRDDPLRSYVSELRAELGRHCLRRRLVGEVEAHLREAIAVRVGEGVAPDRAASDAIESFGAPREVAAALEREVPGRHWLPAVVAATGAAMAAAFAMLALAALPPRESGSGDSAPWRLPDPDSARVGGALLLSRDATEVLATAQALGRRASTCLLRHGGRAGPFGGISDPSGKARAACLALIEANDRFLAGPAFREVLAEAQPRFEAAERCVAAADRAHDSAAAAGSRPEATELSSTGSGGPCHRRDGLPAATA